MGSLNASLSFMLFDFQTIPYTNAPWRIIGAITPIYKSGEKLDPSNYPEISYPCQCHPEDFYCHRQGHVDC